eukprot:EG_transcript_5867
MGCKTSSVVAGDLANVATAAEPPTAPPPPRPAGLGRAVSSAALPAPPLLSPKRRPYSCSQYLCVVEYEVDFQGVVQSPPTASTWGSPTKDGGPSPVLADAVGRRAEELVQPVPAAFFREVLATVSLLQPSVSFRWFADTATHRREMVTLLARLEDAVQVLEVTVHEAAHHAPFLADVHWVEEGDRKACAFCNCFLRDGRWETPEEYQEGVPAKERSLPLPVVRVVCADCSERAVARIAPNFFRSRHCCRQFSFRTLDGPFCTTPLGVPLFVHPAVPLRALGGEGRPALRVLVVVEDAVLRGVLQALLRGLGHRPLTPTGTQDPLDFLHVNVVHAALLDLPSPLASGYDTLQGLQAVYPEVPVVALVASAEGRSYARKAGAKDTVLKPPSGQALQHALEGVTTVKAPDRTLSAWL